MTLPPSSLFLLNCSWWLIGFSEIWIIQEKPKNSEIHIKLYFYYRTSLVAQRMRIRQPVQRTWVWSLVQEDSTCLGATKPTWHNFWSPCALQSLCSTTRDATAMGSSCTTARSRPCSPPLKKTPTKQWRPSAVKNKIKFIYYKYHPSIMGKDCIKYLKNLFKCPE